MDFVVPLKDVSVPEKKQGKFECTITKDVAKAMWYKGADIITSDQKYDTIIDGKKHMLVINCCEFDDEDDYTIEVLGKSSTAKLTVEGKCRTCATVSWLLTSSWLRPLRFKCKWSFCINVILGIRLKFISPLKDQTVKEGKTARFELELSHENIPVSWFKNDVKIHPSRTVVTQTDGKKHVLEIKEVTLDDTCQIKAEAKGIPSMANLTVIGKIGTTFCPISVIFIYAVFQCLSLCEPYWCLCLCVVVEEIHCLCHPCVHYVMLWPFGPLFMVCDLESHLHCPCSRGRPLLHS